MNELAKKTLCDAANPLVIVQNSPTKQSCIFTELVIEEPSETMESSQMTPVPMYTWVEAELSRVQSFRRDTPSMMHPSCSMLLMMARVFTILTPLPMEPRCPRVALICRSTICLIA